MRSVPVVRIDDQSGSWCSLITPLLSVPHLFTWLWRVPYCPSGSTIFVAPHLLLCPFIVTILFLLFSIHLFKFRGGRLLKSLWPRDCKFTSFSIALQIRVHSVKPIRTIRRIRPHFALFAHPRFQYLDVECDLRFKVYTAYLAVHYIEFWVDSHLKILTRRSV